MGRGCCSAPIWPTKFNSIDVFPHKVVEASELRGSVIKALIE